VTEAVRQHRASDAAWDLEAPTAGELRAWAIGVIGKDVPLPPKDAPIVGARRIEVLRRGAALIRLEVGGEPVTYLVQHSRGLSQKLVERPEGDLRAVAWRRGKFTVVAVGSQSSADRWAGAISK
jgi:hypothetical protein